MPKLSRSDPTPLYAQVKQRLLERIAAGDIKPGDRLPSEPELEEAFQVSRITIRRALGDLAAAGYLKRQPGTGTVVTQSRIRRDSGKIGGLRNELIAQGYSVEKRILEHRAGPIDPDDCGRTGISNGAHVLYVRQLLVANGVPVMLSASHHVVPERVRPTAEEIAADSLFTILQHHGLTVMRAERTIEAVLPTAEEAALLEMPCTAPALLVELHAYDAEEHLRSYVRSVYRGDRYKYFHSIEP
jgi:GntR family transcriptional regulator